jgi:Fur family ferric uptake transcriptional regulator
MRASSVEQIILETLAQKQSHLTAHLVYDQIRDRLPAVNPSTVYRALERLVNAGKISVSDLGTGAEVYESMSDGIHHHLVCQKCGSVLTMGHQDVENFFGLVQHSYHFQVFTNHLVLFGLCDRCQKS